jgi:hypothetical protein
LQVKCWVCVIYDNTRNIFTDKFAITTDTGILTYKTIQATAHNNDTVTIVATDVAGNKAEQLIIVSVKVIGLSTSIVWSGIGDDNKLLERLTVTV